ncbi:hypothetical protein HOY80DRAFT_1046307 [Tuber brumale]|nr:hypothetical protein HOY80DRAFT_1046307 [Tuber brumale]
MDDNQVHWEQPERTMAARRHREKVIEAEGSQASEPQPKKVDTNNAAPEARPSVVQEFASPPLCAGPAAIIKDTWTKVLVKEQVQRTSAGQQDPRNSTPAPPSSSPTPNARGRNLTLKFTKRRKVPLPEGVTAESIRACINVTRSNSAKSCWCLPYIKVANIRACVTCIFLSLASHGSSELGNWHEKAKVGLRQHLNIPDFELQMDVEKVKIFFPGELRTDTRRGSSYAVEGWLGNRAIDGLRSDLEASTPGVVTAAHPKMMESIYGMRLANASLQSGMIFLHCWARNVRVFTDNKLDKRTGEEMLPLEKKGANNRLRWQRSRHSRSSTPKIEEVASDENNEANKASAPRPKSAMAKEPVAAFGDRPAIPVPARQVAMEYQLMDGNTSKIGTRASKLGWILRVPYLMSITTIALNMGRSSPNRVQAFDLFSYVYVFFILEPLVDLNVIHVPIEVDGGDLFSFVNGSGVAVFVHSHISGLPEIVGHGDGSAWIRYWEQRERLVVAEIYVPVRHTKSRYTWKVAQRMAHPILLQPGPAQQDDLSQYFHDQFMPILVTLCPTQFPGHRGMCACCPDDQARHGPSKGHCSQVSSLEEGRLEEGVRATLHPIAGRG